MNFNNLGLSPEIQEVISGLGYITPTPIQQQAIPQVLCGRDVFGCAQTGTGKTASFLLPIIDILHHAGKSKSRLPRTIILEPTRELAAQVFQGFEQFAKHTSLQAALLVGGELMSDQEKQLKRGADVLIVTPGRLLDLFERGRVLLAGASILIIDEADRMLDMGFIPDIERIVSLLPKQRQTLFFSATLPDEIKELTKKYLVNPKEIVVSPTTKAAAMVEQFQIRLAESGKAECVKEILDAESPQAVIIFCNRKRVVSTLASSLRRKGYNAQGLHGDMPQKKRNETLASFKSGEFSILVASDVAARGLDVEGLSLVINYDVPFNPDEYIHRIGRTGRAGKEGRAVTFVTPEERKSFNAIEALLKETIQAYSGLQQQALPEQESQSKSNPQQRAQTKPKSKVQHQPQSAPQKTPLQPKSEKVVSSSPVSELVIGFGDSLPAFMKAPTRRHA